MVRDLTGGHKIGHKMIIFFLITETVEKAQIKILIFLLFVCFFLLICIFEVM